MKRLGGWFKKMVQDHKDFQMGRELVGVDRLGNKFYQFYSQQGLPTRRRVDYSPNCSDPSKVDPLWDPWLRGLTELPPTAEELQDMYADMDDLKLKGMEYDLKEEAKMKEFRKVMKKRKETQKTTTDKGYNEEYTPGAWKPK
mmetsp:Transcript_55410/g.63316  ORF Transcript_55410/g.63316 Transcript_55410/m.63316 type:complete len:142 (-) Transcript_55410:107-532(-)